MFMVSTNVLVKNIKTYCKNIHTVTNFIEKATLDSSFSMMKRYSCLQNRIATKVRTPTGVKSRPDPGSSYLLMHKKRENSHLFHSIAATTSNTVSPYLQGFYNLATHLSF